MVSDSSDMIDKRILRLTQKLAKIGSFDFVIPENRVLWTAEMYQIFGVAPELGPLTYEQVNNMVHPDDRELHREQTNRIMQEGKYSFEHRLVWPDGSIHWLWGSAEMEYDEAGKPFRMFGISQDITERKQVEEALLQRTRLCGRKNFTICMALIRHSRPRLIPSI